MEIKWIKSVGIASIPLLLTASHDTDHNTLDADVNAPTEAADNPLLAIAEANQ